MYFLFSPKENDKYFYRFLVILSALLFTNFYQGKCQTQILKWDFDDGNSIPEINLSDGIPSIITNTGSNELFDNDDNGGLALNYTSWDDINLYYEISFSGLGYENFNISLFHKVKRAYLIS